MRLQAETSLSLDGFIKPYKELKSVSPTDLGAPIHAYDDATERIRACVGQLTRTLRDSMREFGLDKRVKAAKAILCARDRLKYVVAMTEQAAERALNAIEVVQPLQEELNERATELNPCWAAWYGAPIDGEPVRTLMTDTRSLPQEVPVSTQTINAQLLEIMLAQDFQDLTGQVIKKIMDVVQNIEQSLSACCLSTCRPTGVSSSLPRMPHPRREVCRACSMARGSIPKAYRRGHRPVPVR